MSATEALRNCPVCDGRYLEEEVDPFLTRRKRYTCKRCGTYEFDKFLVEGNPDFDRVRHLISAWIRRQNDSGIFPVVVGSGMNTQDIKWPQQFEYMWFPKTTDEKMNSLLLAYADKTKYGEGILFSNNPNLISEIAARDIDEIKGLNQLLAQVDYTDFDGSDIFGACDRVRLKAKGWLRVDELRKTSVANDSAFIAMWFNDSITGAYREAVIKTVGECGYNPIFVDQEKFNGFIMDQVVTLIRQSRFIIADYTARPEEDGDYSKVKQGVRGGVYWEAGFAYGMGKPVVHTCEDDREATRRIHFDVDQYKTIYWKRGNLGASIRELTKPIDKPNFMEELAMHILATVGKGSYVPEKK